LVVWPYSSSNVGVSEESGSIWLLEEFSNSASRILGVIVEVIRENKKTLMDTLPMNIGYS